MTYNLFKTLLKLLFEEVNFLKHFKCVLRLTIKRFKHVHNPFSPLTLITHIS